MYYTEKDVEKAIKVLFFEGAGCVERGDVENCRIRTAFTNNEGKGIYLELMGFDVTKTSPDKHKVYKVAGIADFCHYTKEIRIEQTNPHTGKTHYYIEYEPVENVERGQSFEYSKQGILNFVNEKLNCSFTEIKVLDSFDGYRVHKDGGGYNFIEDFEYKPEIAEARRAKYNEVDMQIREQLCEKYSKIGLNNMDDESITVRIFASNESMRRHEMDPNKRLIRVKI